MFYPDLGVEVVVLVGVHWLSIQQHLALLWKIEVFQQIHTGALATARRSHKSSDLPRPQSE